jgi:hypothetical protein
MPEKADKQASLAEKTTPAAPQTGAAGFFCPEAVLAAAGD